MTTLIHERVEMAQSGANPAVICQVPSGWVVLGDVQFLRGYSLLLADPVVADINVLNHAQRRQFLHDMTLVGDALLEVTGAYRINYEILGNSEPALHAHLFPRYMSEPDEQRKGPAWLYDREYRLSVKLDLARDGELIQQIAQAIRLRL